MDTPVRKSSSQWKHAWIAWDPYDVWQRLLRINPVCVDDPAATTGQMSSSMARDFWVTVAEFPDALQDALFVIAHAQGFEHALAVLDQAIGEHLSARAESSNLVPLKRPARGRKKKPATSSPDRTRAAS